MAKKDLINRDNNEPRPSRGQLALRIIFGKTMPQKMFRAYLLAIVIGAILLYLPISLQHGHQIYTYQTDTREDSLVPSGKSYTFWDALLISCSALSTTGLTPLALSINLTPFGQAVIFVLFELGGIGLLSIIYCLWSLFKRKARDQLAETVILQAERGNEKLAGTLSTLKRSIVLILVIQVFFAFIMSFWLCFMPLYHQTEFTNGLSSIDSNTYITAHHNYGKAFWQGLFMSASSINNAGFDILDGESSLGALRNDWNVIFQLMVLLELIIGGIGYPLIFDFWEKAKYKRKGLKYRISLFTKICLLGFIVVSVAGLAFTFGFEYGFRGDTINIVSITDGKTVDWHLQATDIAHYNVTWTKTNSYQFDKTFGKHSEFNKAFAIFFNTMTTRSAGFTTASMNTLSPGSQWTYIILMFIGGSPSSTAGGIRTTTLVIAVAAIVAFVRGKKEVTLFHRTVPHTKVRASYIVIITGVAVVCLFSIIIYLNSGFASNGASTGDIYRVDGSNGVLETFFETASAIGTVGDSMGLTPTINDFGLVLLMILMFIGYLGISSTLLSWTKKNPRGNLIKYAEEDVRIG